MEEQTSVPSCSKHGELLMKLPGMRMLLWTRSHEALRVWCSICRGYGSACLEDGRINRSPYSSFLEVGPGSRWSRSQRILAASLGTKLLARCFQDRSFTTTSFREPISQLMDIAFVFARHVHGGQLQLARLRISASNSLREVSRIQGRLYRKQANSNVDSGTANRALERDQSSFQSCMLCVLTASRGVSCPVVKCLRGCGFKGGSPKVGIAAEGECRRDST